jgi:hypothetical protein
MKAENLRIEKLLIFSRSFADNVYGLPFVRMLGDVPRLRINCGDFFGDFNIKDPFSLSGDGELPPPEAELRREDPNLTSK